MALTITPNQAYLYFSIYLIISIYFGTGIISLNKTQESKLNHLHKEPILNKLKLSKKILREILCNR